MGNCGTREESVVIAAHAQVQQLHMFQMPVKNTSLEKKHNRSFSDMSGPSTHRNIEDSRNIAIYNNVIAFTLFELETITKSFRSDYVLGEGGFRTVYKGYIDENVRVGLKSLLVAVKVLSKDGLQGYREWLTEVNFLGQLRHPNLVKLIGYCCEDDHRLLVYEFMFHGSLEKHLFRSGFLMSIVWAYIITRELVALLVSMGHKLSIRPAVLRPTLLAWGNSIGDLIGNVVIDVGGGESGDNEVQITIYGCYARPIFNTLVGLGMSLVFTL